MATSITTTSTNTARSAGEGNDQLEPHSYADDPNDGVEADARTGSSDSYSLDASDPAPSGHDQATQGKDGLSEALKAERRRSNNLEKELRGVRQQLTPWGGRWPWAGCITVLYLLHQVAAIGVW